MNLIDSQLQKIKQQKRLGLMTHVVVGYPSLEKTKQLVIAMEEVGVDLIELQIPFSDPLADGPTIMRACEESLEQGTKVKDAFEVAKELTAKVSIPILFMAYYNTVFKYGVRKFCQDAKMVGISGLIVPDMPIEEESSEHFIVSCREFGLYEIHVISPSTTKQRMKLNSRFSKGFVYCTARQGITGAKNKLDPKIANYLKDSRKEFKVPLAVGFGISSKDRVEMIRRYADIAVVGSGVIDVINSSKSSDMIKNVKQFIKELGV